MVKKIYSIFLLGFFLVALITSPGSGQTAEEIIKKTIEVQGGKKLFESMKDITLSGSLELILVQLLSTRRNRIRGVWILR
jgi:hypothetical protein